MGSLPRLQEASDCDQKTKRARIAFQLVQRSRLLHARPRLPRENASQCIRSYCIQYAHPSLLLQARARAALQQQHAP